jgi:hypothetical protein
MSPWGLAGVEHTHRDSSNESRTGENVRAFPDFLQDRNGVWSASSVGGTFGDASSHRGDCPTRQDKGEVVELPQLVEPRQPSPSASGTLSAPTRDGRNRPHGPQHVVAVQLCRGFPRSCTGIYLWRRSRGPMCCDFVKRSRRCLFGATSKLRTATLPSWSNGRRSTPLLQRSMSRLAACRQCASGPGTMGRYRRMCLVRPVFEN